MGRNYKKQFPTQGDLAHEQLRRRGIPDWSDVQKAIRVRLAKLVPDGRKAFAVACAEQLMAAHEHVSPEEQRPFTLRWRPVLDAIWRALAGETEHARTVVQALRAFHEGEYDHALGQDGPDDADHDPAAASIYAGECYRAGDVDNAFWASGRVVDSAFRSAGDALNLDPDDFEWDPNAEPPMPLVREAMHPAVQGALARQLSDLGRLEREGVTPTVLHYLRAR